MSNKIYDSQETYNHIVWSLIYNNFVNKSYDTISFITESFLDIPYDTNVKVGMGANLVTHTLRNIADDQEVNPICFTENIIIRTQITSDNEPSPLFMMLAYDMLTVVDPVKETVSPHTVCRSWPKNTENPNIFDPRFEQFLVRICTASHNMPMADVKSLFTIMKIIFNAMQMAYPEDKELDNILEKKAYLL